MTGEEVLTKEIRPIQFVIIVFLLPRDATQSAVMPQ